MGSAVNNITAANQLLQCNYTIDDQTYEKLNHYYALYFQRCFMMAGTDITTVYMTTRDMVDGIFTPAFARRAYLDIARNVEKQTENEAPLSYTVVSDYNGLDISLNL